MVLRRIRHLTRRNGLSQRPSSGFATWTHSLPLVRPLRAFASQTPFAVSQTAQVSRSRGRRTWPSRPARRTESQNPQPQHYSQFSDRLLLGSSLRLALVIRFPRDIRYHHMHPALVAFLDIVQVPLLPAQPFAFGL